MHISKRHVLAFLLLFVVLLLGVIWLLNSHNSFVSNTFTIIFIILGVLAALAQWLFPFSPSISKTPSRPVRKANLSSSQHSLTSQHKQSLEPLGWRAWMRIVGKSFSDTLETGLGFYLLVVWGGSFLAFGTIWILSVIGLPVTANINNPFFVTLWIFWGFCIFAVRYVYIAGEYLEVERSNAKTK
jgi:hypothetical protein